MIAEEVKAGSLRRAATLARDGKTNLEELRASVKRFKLLQPIIVRKEDGMVIIGQRRQSVAKALGMKAPVVELDVDKGEAAVIRLSEELSHAPHDVMKVAMETRRIYEAEIGEKKVTASGLARLAKLLGTTVNRIKHLLDVADISPEIRKHIGESLPLYTAQVIHEASNIQDEDKERLARKAAAGSGAVTRNTVREANRHPEAAKEWARDANPRTTIGDVIERRQKHEEKADAKPTDTLYTLALSIHGMIRRWADTLADKPNYEMLPALVEDAREKDHTARVVKQIAKALSDLAAAAGKWSEILDSEKRTRLPATKVKELVLNAKGMWESAT